MHVIIIILLPNILVLLKKSTYKWYVNNPSAPRQSESFINPDPQKQIDGKNKQDNAISLCR
jgi:hypothetical protein